jgi:hypothetical protein
MIVFQDELMVAGDNIIEVENQLFHHISWLDKSTGKPLAQTPFIGLGTGNATLVMTMVAEDSLLIFGGAFQVLEDLYHPDFAWMVWPARDTGSGGPLLDPAMPVEDITVFPNPFSDILHLELQDAQKGSLVQIRDLQGRLLHSFAFNEYEKNAVINMGGLPAGTYILQLSYDDHFIHRKVIKK